MAKKKLDHAVRLIRETNPAVILKAASLCDGHTILNPEAFIDAGLAAEVVEFATTTYKSDGSPKGTIFVRGEPVPELTGVYGLNLLTLLADALGVRYRSCMGRGFQASAIQEALRRHLLPPTSSSSSGVST